MAKATTTNVIPSVLSFQRNLNLSAGLFYAGTMSDRDNFARWPRVAIEQKGIRGTISNRPTKEQLKDPTKLDADVTKPNIQSVDVAHLPFEADTLGVAFSLRITGGVGRPDACNNADFLARLNDAVQGYLDETGVRELARRYVTNIANARFLWRNRLLADAVEVRVVRGGDDTERREWVFDALAQSLQDLSVEGDDDFSDLVSIVAQALEGDTKNELLHIHAFARLGNGQEVFPSQEMVMDAAATGKSKTLYEIEGGAGMHSQKIGNALRTIDDWHPEAGETGPIPVEPYGSVSSKGRAYRAPGRDKLDFYSLFDRWISEGHAPSVDQQHFVIANLIRGGVFGKAKEG